MSKTDEMRHTVLIDSGLDVQLVKMIVQDISSKRMGELEKYVQHRPCIKLTRGEEREWICASDKLFSNYRIIKKPTAKDLALDGEIKNHDYQIESLAPTTCLEVIFMLCCRLHMKDEHAQEIEDDAESAVNGVMAPFLEDYKKSKRENTPASMRTWWENARSSYERVAGPLESDKWIAVAKIVIRGAEEARNRTPLPANQTDYLTPRMMKTLLKKLAAPDASLTKITRAYAEKFRHDVAKAEKNASKS